MSLRAVPAAWFEVLTPQEDSARTAGALARTGAVEIEVRGAGGPAMDLQALESGLAQYRELLGRYVRYWSRGELRHSAALTLPERTLSDALQRIRDWQRSADPLISRLQAQEEERARLGAWEQVLQRLQHRALDFAALLRCGPALQWLVVLLPGGAVLDTPGAVVRVDLPLGPGQRCLLALGRPQDVDALRRQARAAKARVLERPAWLIGSSVEALLAVQARRAEQERTIARLYAEIDALHEDAGLPDALGDLVCLEWFVKEVGPLALTQCFAWVTGWTERPDADSLRRALEREGARALVRLSPAPAGVTAPLLLRNPAWVRPFEVFARALGTPSAQEADPSLWLALVVPLLFGYMFGDVGQGLVLLVAGLALRRRWDLAWLLVACGGSAVLFGLVFGSVFSREDLIPALWMPPLHAPLAVLGLPLVLGVALLAGGQLLGALQARWRGELGRWLGAQAGFLLMYLGAVGTLIWPDLYPVALAGLLWFVAGRVARRPGIGALAGALGAVLEDGLRLLVNTVSFARVGAFALAHAGLSGAVATLADAAGAAWAWLLIMIAGNLLIIALEGLVVSVQTTRLVLFEFFSRFLQAQGRPFRPLPAPPAVLRGESYEVAA